MNRIVPREMRHAFSAALGRSPGPTPLVLLLGMLLAGGGCASETGETGPDAAGAAGPDRPNVIFVVADDLGYGDLGSYGQERIRTPHLDRMAREGMRFTEFYAGATVCAPSRSVLMTGRHTGRTYIRGNREIDPYGQEPLPDSILTLAEVLSEAGYRTGLIGKWGLGPPNSEGAPTNQGFDYFFGYLGQRHAHNYYPEFLFRNDERVSLPNEVPGDRPDGAGQAVRKNVYSHDLMAEEVLSFIRRSAGAAGADGGGAAGGKADAGSAGRRRPFFLEVAYTIPHANNEAGEEGMEVPDYGPYAEEDWPAPQKGLAAMITRMDEDVGEMFALLDSLGIDEHTVVFFTSDNGPHAEGGNDPQFFDSNGPLRGIKRDLYEGGIRVPMLVRWPGEVPPGTTSDFAGYFPDVMPTLAELAGAEVPERIDGISFADALRGRAGEQAEHEYLYWEFYAQGSKQAVRSGRWKAVRRPMTTGETELYDLENDLGEREDLAAERPEVVERLEETMEEAHRPSTIWTPPSEQTGATP